MQNRALGKGLTALIPEKNLDQKSESVAQINTNEIKDNALQPRLNYNDAKLSELVASIKEKGVLQPILVRKKGSGYEVIAGERRLRAARILNLDKVPVIIKDVSDDEALVLALVENIQREELNAIEEAQAYERLINQFQFSHESIAQSVGKDRSTISNMLRLLKLPDFVQQSIVQGELSMGHARALLSIENTGEQRKLFEKTLKKGLSVRELENYVKRLTKVDTKHKSKRTSLKSTDVIFLEEDLQKTLGTKVRIIANRKRGKILIEYYSPDDLDRIINIIKASAI